jgi:phosphoribosylglycinamide formyltransferase-1
MKSIVIFASGSGTNAENIISYYAECPKARVTAVFCNKPGAGVIERAKKWNVPVVLFNKENCLQVGILDEQLNHYRPDIIVLAGFLWLFPDRLVKKYNERILNIHPALLPAYGGKGMYGEHVHRAVLQNGDKIHGVTVHKVNEKYDEGEIILQESFAVEAGETLTSLSEKINKVEFSVYPQAISKILGI